MVLGICVLLQEICGERPETSRGCCVEFFQLVAAEETPYGERHERRQRDEDQLFLTHIRSPLLLEQECELQEAAPELCIWQRRIKQKADKLNGRNQSLPLKDRLYLCR